MFVVGIVKCAHHSRGKCAFEAIDLNSGTCTGNINGDHFTGTAQVSSSSRDSGNAEGRDVSLDVSLSLLAGFNIDLFALDVALQKPCLQKQRIQ